jgi:hypothetical protein
MGLAHRDPSAVGWRRQDRAGAQSASAHPRRAQEQAVNGLAGDPQIDGDGEVQERRDVMAIAKTPSLKASSRPSGSSPDRVVGGRLGGCGHPWLIGSS